MLSQSIITILKWILGATEAVPSDESINLNELAEILVQSGLVFRAYYGLRSSRKHRFSAQFVAQIICLYNQWRKTVDAQIRAARSVDVGLKTCGCNPAILLKGLSIYAITGQELHLPVSTDVDILTPDYLTVCKYLEGMEFDSRYNPECDREAAYLWYGSAYIELHRYSNSWSYPAGLCDSFSISTRYHQRMMIRDVRWHGISYDDLFKHTQSSRILGTQRLVILSSTLCALLLCIHAFTNYIEPGSWRVKLSEIANVHDLFQCSDFSELQFNELTISYQAEDCVNFVRALIAFWYESDDKEISANHCFPLRLTYYGVWAKPYDLTELLCPLSKRRIIDHIDPSDIVATFADLSPNIYYGNHTQVSDFTPIHCLDHYHIEEQGSYFTSRFCAHADKDGILFDLSIVAHKDLEGECSINACTSDVNGGLQQSVKPLMLADGIFVELFSITLQARAWWSWKDNDTLRCFLNISLESIDLGIIQTSLFPLRITRLPLDEIRYEI